MFKYIIFLTIGIIIFILLNHNENFNIGNQFSTYLQQIENNRDVACPIEAESCRQSLMDRGGACALFQLLKLYAIQGEVITREELDIIVDKYDTGTSRDDTLEVLNILGNTGESMMNILSRNNIGRSALAVECTLVDLVDIYYIMDEITAHINLDEYLENNKLYMASINLQFQKGAYPPEPSKVGIGHAFLIYKDINPDRQIVYYIFDGCNPDLDNIESTDNDNNLDNIASYWITKFGINKEKMISCNIALYIYHNVEAVCATLLALGQSGGGYGGVGGGGYSGGGGYGRATTSPRIDPDSNGNSDSDLEDEDETYIELIQTLISNREIRIIINREDLELDIEDIDLYTYRPDDNALYLLFVPLSRRSEIEVDEELEILYNESNDGFRYIGNI